MSKIAVPALSTILLLATAACSTPEQQAADNADLRLRNLTESSTAASRKASYPIQGDLIPTPSDKETRYFLIRQRKPLSGETIVAVLREERAGKAAYARVEVDCGKRLFHIVGVGNRRSFAETSRKSDGALRSMNGYPLRQEIANFMCKQHGTPLAKSPDLT